MSALSPTELQQRVAMKNAVSLVSSTGSPMNFKLVSQKKATKVDHEHLLDLARQISSADSHIKGNTTGKLKQIYEQIQALQKQAVKIMEDAKRDKMLHTAACNIKKRPGQIYYLYQKKLAYAKKPKTSETNPNSDMTIESDDEDDTNQPTENYFSIMSPEDWGKNCPHKYLGAYRLNYDMMFTPFEEIEKMEDTRKLIENIYEQNMSGASNSIEWKL